MAPTARARHGPSASRRSTASGPRGTHPAVGRRERSAMTEISRKEYAGLFGPTVGDKIRLGDTGLLIEIERDLRVLGDEAIYGGGKTLRDGMGMNNQLTSEGGALDLVITNETVVDAVLGV